MTTWQYRVGKRKDTLGGYEYYIKEIYFDADDKYWGSADAGTPLGESLDELKADLMAMLKATELEVMEDEDGE